MQKTVCLPILLAGTLILPTSTQAQLKVFILAGQSNMAGRGTVDGENDQGSLEWLFNNQPDEYGHLKDASGDWVERDDVWIWCKRTNKGLSETVASTLEGPLTAGQGFNDTYIGPELGFGHVIGDYFDEQVLILKHAWGGTAIGKEWLSPSQPGYIEPPCCETGDRQNDGFYYHLMFDEINTVLSDIGAIFPDYDESAGYEIMGLAWHQGFNDQFDGLADSYEENLVRFIGDVRAELDIEDLPWVIGASEHSGGTIENQIRPAQINIGDPTLYPEFEGNLLTSGGDLLQPQNESPGNDGSHYFLNAYTYMLVGEAMAESMIELMPDVTEVNDPAEIKNSHLVTYLQGSRALVFNKAHRFSIYDLQGAPVLSGQNTVGKAYQLKSLPAGIYFIAGKIEGASFNLKIYLQALE